MIRTLVTGGAGFIGSHLVTRLLEDGHDVTVIDNFSTGRPDNLDHLKGRQGLTLIQADITDGASILPHFQGIDWVFHLAALADIVPSIEKPEAYFRSNVDGTFNVLQAAKDAGVKRFVYAASSSCYGIPDAFPTPETSEIRCEYPYALTKNLGEQLVMHWGKVYKLPVVCLRLFNVYGPRESHKGRMASVAFHHFNQYRAEGKVKLFEGCDGYANGEQQRDFVYVKDVAKVNLYFLDHPEKSGIFNLGTGRAQSFNDVAVATVNSCRAAEGKPALSLEAMVQQGLVEYVAFPEALKGKYQSFTQADLSKLRSAGYGDEFATVAEGVADYVQFLNGR